MAAGVDSDFGGNPIVVTFNGSSAAHTLPYTMFGAQGNGMALPWLPKRIRWVSKTGAQDDEVIIKDLPGNPAGTTNQREIVHFVATGADFETEVRPRGHELYMGAVITVFGSGTLFIYL